MNLSKLEMDNIVKNYRVSDINMALFWKSVEKAAIKSIKYNKATKKYEKTYSYGDKLTENIV